MFQEFKIISVQLETNWNSVNSTWIFLVVMKIGVRIIPTPAYQLNIAYLVHSKKQGVSPCCGLTSETDKYVYDTGLASSSLIFRKLGFD